MALGDAIWGLIGLRQGLPAAIRAVKEGTLKAIGRTRMFRGIMSYTFRTVDLTRFSRMTENGARHTGNDGPLSPKQAAELLNITERTVSELLRIGENGVPDHSDRIRPWLLVNAIQRMHDLLKRGYDLRGYFHWSLTDNFEWVEGWRLRFGLYELDQHTQVKAARPSAEVFRRIIAANGLTPELLAQHADLHEGRPVLG
jgi:hypothetical protein